MKIGPRTNEIDNRTHHTWIREINGVGFHFVHVKATRLERPYIGVTRMDTGALVRCSCPRDDCPSAA